MECPKCGLDIDDKATVCPNCKKVLKLICPICKSVNESNTCRKCGYVIITKCHKCGKINQTFTKKCRACAFSLEHSVIFNESNTDDFVMLTIDFPNLSEMKTVLGDSIQAFNKFKANLENIITSYAKSAKLRRQVFGSTYVIRFNKAYTFSSSANEAVEGAIEILNKITTMNAKLSKRKNTNVRCNMFLIKRSVKSNPNDYKAALNISLLELDAKDKKEKVLNTFQVLTDPDVQSALEKHYSLAPLNAVMVNDQMVMYYELDVKDIVRPEFESEKDEEKPEIPEFISKMIEEQEQTDWQELNKADLPDDPDEIYDIETINFEEINCDFQRVENIDVFDNIAEKLKAIPKGIIALKTPQLYKPYSAKLIGEIYGLNLYNNIIPITCHSEMKYAPYGFFREFIATVFEYAVSQKLFAHNDFSMFSAMDPDGLVKDLICLNEREFNEETKYIYFDIFLTLLQVIPNTLIIIEDFDKIDDSSHEAMRHLMGALEDLEISWILTHSTDFSLHKQSHYLLSKPYYTEINLKPAPIARLVDANKDFYRNVLDNFYFHRVMKYSCGSMLYVDFALQYLLESEVFILMDDSVEAGQGKTVIIPSNLDNLVKRRLDIMKDNKELFRFLLSVVLLGTRIDLETIKALGFEKPNEIIEQLEEMGYAYLYNNCLYFSNYNLLRKNMLECAGKKYLKEVAAELLEKVCDNVMPSVMKAELYNLAGETHAERGQWEALAQITLSLGDMSAYLNCVGKIIELLDAEEDAELLEATQEYKLQLYENISGNLSMYDPQKNEKLVMSVLESLSSAENKDRILALCNKMISGCLVAGDYAQAEELTHRVMSLLPTEAIDPEMPEFNSYFFLIQLVYVQVLFNRGKLDECLDIGTKVLAYVKDESLETLKPDNFEMDDFKAILIDAVGYVVFANVLSLRGDAFDVFEGLRKQFSAIPETFSIFLALQDFIHGNMPAIEPVEPPEVDKFSAAIFFIIDAFMSCANNPAEFAQRIYQAKNCAKMFELHQVESFCDLLIGYAYMNLGTYEKAENIFQELIKSVKEKGMEMLSYGVQYLIGEMQVKLGKYDVAHGIINNSLITLERNNTFSEYILLLFKYSMFRILMFQQRYAQAEILINQADYITKKYGLNFEFDLEPTHYIPVGYMAVPNDEPAESITERE